MASIRRRGGGTVDDGLDIITDSEPETVIVNSGASDVVSPAGQLPPDLLNAPVGMDDDLSHALASGPPRRRLPGATAFLVSAVLIAGGFLGGVITQKHEGGSSSGGTSAAALAAAFRTRAGGTGTAATGTGTAGTGTAGTGAAGGFGGGAAGGTTVGTVKLVDGTTIYLTATDGSTVKVTTSAATTIKVTKNGVPSDLAPGTTVVVAGTAGSDGVVKATSVTQGGGTGGFGGGAGGFGGRTRTGGGGTGTGTGTGGAGAAAGGGNGG
jgi:hypothetical protein